MRLHFVLVQTISLINLKYQSVLKYLAHFTRAETRDANETLGSDTETRPRPSSFGSETRLRPRR